jgi:predicted Zn-dependent protease with MMP-like domain
MFQVSNERFEELAAEAVTTLPESLSSHMDNVAIIVEDEAPGKNLFGLYEGIPLTRRGFSSYNARHARSNHTLSDDDLPRCAPARTT